MTEHVLFPARYVMEDRANTSEKLLLSTAQLPFLDIYPNPVRTGRFPVLGAANAALPQ